MRAGTGYLHAAAGELQCVCCACVLISYLARPAQHRILCHAAHWGVTVVGGAGTSGAERKGTAMSDRAVACWGGCAAATGPCGSARTTRRDRHLVKK
mmetsp:Transcript_30503/g.55702  ORF Transcript_30503/g.55702 Transcript_30503/m.55702 type:complete len:97 (-) Transcript_30503:1273-1563(-)